MAASFIQLPPDSTGKFTATDTWVQGANTVHAQASTIYAPDGTVLTSANGVMTHTPDTQGSGTITVTDAVVAAPAGAGAFVSGTSTAGSYVATAIPGGDSAWVVQVTGLTSGTLYFEGSIDSTNGVNGNWMNLNGRRTGIVNTQLAASATADGMYRGNTAGLTYFRVRSVGALTGTPAIIERFTSGPGPVFMNASIPAGTNAIGTTSLNAALPAGGNAIGTVAINAALPGGTNTIGSVTAIGQTSATATITSVTGSVSSVALHASNTSRKALYIYNDSTSNLYVALGATASTTVFSYLMAPNAFWELPDDPVYTGAVNGIWTTATGAARITELT